MKGTSACSAHKGQKRDLDPLEQELKVDVSFLGVGAGNCTKTEIRFSRRTLLVLNHGAIASAVKLYSFSQWESIFHSLLMNIALENLQWAK